MEFFFISMKFKVFSLLVVLIFSLGFGQQATEGKLIFSHPDHSSLVFTYVGEIVNNKANGYGQALGDDNSFYMGEFRQNYFHGEGSYIWGVGDWEEDTYDGEWEFGKMSGEGMYRSASGWQYEGKFKDGKKHGFGKYTYKDGSVYNGQFHEDKKHGLGVMLWVSGARYEGEFKQGKRHGQGAYFYPSGSHYEGQWENGDCNGFGVLTYKDGRKEVGLFKDDQFIEAVDDQTLASIAWHYVEQLEDYFFAYKLYNLLLERNPKDANGFYGKAVLFFMVEEYALALDEIQHAIELNDKVANFYELRGSIYELLGELTKAEKDYAMSETLKSE